MLEKDEWENERITDRLVEKEKFLEKKEKQHDNDIKNIERGHDSNVIHTLQKPLIPHKFRTHSHFNGLKNFMDKFFHADKWKNNNGKN